MSTIRRMLALGLCMLLAAAPAALAAKNKFAKDSVRLDRGPRMYYWVHVPESTETAEGLPLVIYLHGSGERGERALSGGLPALVNDGLDFPAVLLVPQLPKQGSWKRLEKQVLAMIDEVKEAYAPDMEHVTVVGYSLGANFGWEWMTMHPDLAGRFVSVCGRLEHPEEIAPDDFAGIRVKTYVGAKDTNVNPKTSSEFTQLLIDDGYEAELIVLDATHSQVLKRAFRDDALIQWLCWREAPDEPEETEE